MEELTLQVSYLILFIRFRYKGCLKYFLLIKYTYVSCLNIAMLCVFVLCDLIVFMVQ